MSSFSANIAASKNRAKSGKSSGFGSAVGKQRGRTKASSPGRGSEQPPPPPPEKSSSPRGQPPSPVRERNPPARGGAMPSLSGSFSQPRASQPVAVQGGYNGGSAPKSTTAVTNLSKLPGFSGTEEDSIVDSRAVCVGAAPKLLAIPRGGRGCRFCSVDVNFLTHLEWAARFGIGALICACPAFVGSAWLREATAPIADFDKSYAAVVFVFVFGYSVGETNQHIFQFATGGIAAAIVPQLAVNTFGASLFAVCMFLGLYTLLVLSLPLQALTKKFALGLCVHHLMESYRRQYTVDIDPATGIAYLDGRSELALNREVPYQVLLLGCVGAGVAVLMNMTPYPRTAIGAAFRSINLVVNDIQHAHKYLVRAYIHGANLQDRARTLKYFNHLTEEIRQLEMSLEFAWWENYVVPGARTKTQKYKAVLALCHKLRTDLFGMQKALIERKLDRHHAEIMNMAYISDMDMSSQTDRHTLENAIDHLNYSCDIALKAIQRYVAQDRSAEMIKQNPTVATMAKKIRDALNGTSSTGDYNPQGALNQLEAALKIFHSAYACIRNEQQRVELADKERLERDEWLNIFLFSLTSFTQALLDFPHEYAKGLENASAQRNIFLPEQKNITLNFQKRQLISAIKTALAIVAAAVLNAFFFKTTSVAGSGPGAGAFTVAPVVIAYIMGGHIGGSWANTADRVTGLIGGMVLSYFFIIFSTRKNECNEYAIGTGFAVLTIAAGYIKAASPTHSYTGMVAAFIQVKIMVKDDKQCTIDPTQQLEVVQQIVLASLIVTVVELAWGASSALFFRKQAMETLNHVNNVSKSVLKKLEKNSAEDTKNVDQVLWRVLPSMLDKQELYLRHAALEPSLYANDLPFDAYQQLIVCGRRLNLHMILMHRALTRVEEMRAFAKTPMKGWDPQQEVNPHLLLDQLSIQEGGAVGGLDDGNTMIKDLQTRLQDCFGELADELKANMIVNKEVNNSEHNDRENKDQISEGVRREMDMMDDEKYLPDSYQRYARNDWHARVLEGRTESLPRLFDVALSPPDWWIRVHPTASRAFKELGGCAQMLMKRVYSEEKREGSPLRTALLGSTPDPDDDELKAQLVAYRNNDLMTFHAIAASMRGFVETLLEYDRLFWGGDAGWVHAQFQ